MEFYLKAENRLIKNTTKNKEIVVGVIYDKKLINEIVALLNGEV